MKGFYEGFVDELEKVALLGRVKGRADFRWKKLKESLGQKPVADPSASQRKAKKETKAEAK